MRGRVIGVASAAFGWMLYGLAAAAAPADTQPAAPAATRVTLHVKNVPVQQALDQLQKLSGVTLSADTPQVAARFQQAHVTIEADGEPFWTVLGDICDPAAVRPHHFMPGHPGIVLGDADGAWAAPWIAVDGPFVIGLMKVEEEQRLTYGGREPIGPIVYTLSFEVAAEPAISAQVQAVKLPHIDLCLDEGGFPIQAMGRLAYGAQGPGMFAIQARSDSATKISLLQGACTLAMEAAPKHVDVPNILTAHDVALTVGDHHLQIKQVQKNGRLVVLQVLVLRDEMDDAALNQFVQTVSRSKPIFLDAHGNDAVFKPSGFSTRAAPNGMMVWMSFNPMMGPADPSSMSWDIPTSVIDVKIPFSFKNVPLPTLPGSAGNPAAPKPPRPPIVLVPASQPAPDYARQVAQILVQLSANSAETREDGTVRLGLLPPQAFNAVAAAAEQRGLPMEAQTTLADFVQRNRPLQEARLRRAKAIAQEQDWDERTALESYGQVGKHDPRWDALVAKAVHLYCTTCNDSYPPEAREALEAALEAGCDDPMVVSMAAFVLERRGAEPRQIPRLYDQADQDFRVSRYPAGRKIWNTIRYISLLHRTSSAEANAGGSKFLARADLKKWEYLRTELDGQWPAAAKEGGPPTRVLAIALRLISITKSATMELEPLYKEISPFIDAALPGKPEPLVLKGSFYIDWAWEARGTDFADKVADVGWKLFAQRLVVAEQALNKAYAIDPTDPAAPTYMLSVELGQGKGNEVMELWFKRAMDADPDNYQACLSKIYYLQPKWHGSVNEVLNFAQECYRTGNYRAHMPMILAEAHLYLSADLPQAQKDLYFANPAVWRDIQRVYEPYLRVERDDVDARSAYCGYACRAGRWSIAAKQFDLLGANVVPAYFGYGTVDEVKELRQKAKSKATPADGL